MRLIQQDKHNPKRLEITWMWLPMFIAQNQQMLGELDHVLTARFPPPFEPTERKLNEIHRFVIDWICTKIRIPGLWHYLLAVENVGAEGLDGPETDKRIMLSKQMLELLSSERLAELVQDGRIERRRNPLTSGDLFYLPIEEETDEPVPD
jgi:hypothetical protein